MFVIDLTKLQTGDILLSKTDNRLSNIMENKTGCKYHHAMLYVGESSYIHSDKGPGVQSGNAMRMIFQNADDVIALRIADITNLEIIDAIENSARMKIGTEYSFDEAKRTVSQLNDEDFEPNRQFCTRLVAQAYSESGLDIVENPDYCSPQDIINSEYLSIIPDVLKVGTEKEIAYANEKNTVLEKQEKIHNEILQKTRTLTGADIQTLDQLTDFLLSNQHLDTQITKIIIESGYFYMWQWEAEKNPHNYEKSKFAAFYPQKVWPYVGKELIDVAQQNMQRYSFMLENYKRIFCVYPLMYVKEHIDLYEILVRQMQKMNDVGYWGLVNSKNPLGM